MRWRHFIAILLFGGCHCGIDLDKPIVQPPRSGLSQIRFAEPLEPQNDPTARCESCHSAIVKSYRKSAKANTLGPINPQLHNVMVNNQNDNLEYRLSLELTESPKLIATEVVRDKAAARSVALSLQFGSRNHSLGAIVGGSLGVMPAHYEIEANRWNYFLGYRQHHVDLLSADKKQDCASCHGLTMVSQVSALHDACLGDLSEHLSAPNDKTACKTFRRVTDTKEVALAVCHTHVNARDWA